MGQEIVFLNGQYVDINNANISIFDRGFSYGDGLFETMRSYSGHIFQLDLHLKRFFKSTQDIFITVPYNPEQLSEIISEVINKNGLKEAIIKLTITRGVSEPGLSIQSSNSPTLLVYARPYKPLPKEHYENGVNVSLHSFSAAKISGLSTQIKSCNYLSNILIKKLADDKDTFEGIMLNEKGHVCEGTTSNIFIVKNDVLITPPISQYVLEGVTRKVILDIAKCHNIIGKEDNFTAKEIESANEVFLTNTGIEVLPVSKVDNLTLKKPAPGPLTNFLYGQFLNLIDEVSN
jgi:branched-chain amino acid aminotransferase